MLTLIKYYKTIKCKRKLIEQFILIVNRTNCSQYNHYGDYMKYKRIRDLREDADITQTELGNILNLPQRTYAYYESGQRTIPPEILIKLADYYETSVDYILGRVDER